MINYLQWNNYYWESTRRVWGIT